MIVPFCLPEIGEEEKAAVMRVMDSNWLTSGAEMSKFEAMLTEEFGKKAIAVNSATAGLHLALGSLGIGPGDEVIVPTLTFNATAEVVEYCGAKVVFADVTGDNLCIDPIHARELVTEHTKAIIPVHFAGNWAEVHLLPKDIPIIEDSAHLFHKYGVWKDAYASVFSFYATKCITTAGEGGAILSNRPEVLEYASKMRLHGIDRDAFGRYTSKLPAWEYDIIGAGFKYNMTDIAAAMGQEQLKKNDRMLGRRQVIADMYRMHFDELPVRLPHDGNIVWHLYTINVPHSRGEFIDRMYERGVRCSVHFKPLHLMSYWKAKNPEVYLPVAESYYETCVSLPIYSAMTDEQVSQVINVVGDVCKAMY